MSLTIIDSPRVSCLTCNSKVELSSTKNIYKTKFTLSGESLAPFVSSTLSLTAKKFRSSYLCLRCLNLFGKLEEASRKVASIKSEIHKVFQDSYRNEKNIPVTIQKVEKDFSTKGNNAQVPSAKPKVVITLCTQRKITNTSVQNKTITNNLGLSVNPEKEKFSIVQWKNNRPVGTWTNVSTYQECLKSSDSHAEAVAKALPENGALSSEIPLHNDDVNIEPSLKDHQYGQLPIRVNVDSISKTKEPVSSTKVLSAVQQKVSPKKKKKVGKPKKLELPNSESYTCFNCGIEKDTLQDLKIHYKTHAELYPYMCEKCGKVYKYKKSLILHLNAHERISEFTCTICDKSFSQKSTLKRHLPMHTGEKPYECQVCLKKFVHHTSYQMHILVHTQEKKYKCEICSIAFMSSSHLKRHVRTHTGEKKHSCNVCGKRFYERYNVVAHMKTHDPQLERVKKELMKQKQPIKRRCERCKIDFASAGEYNVHIRKHTPENMPSKENKYINGIQLVETKHESTSTS